MGESQPNKWMSGGSYGGHDGAFSNTALASTSTIKQLVQIAVSYKTQADGHMTVSD